VTTQRHRARVVQSLTALVVCCLLAAPALVLLGYQLSTLRDNAKTTGDKALIELYTLRAAAGHQLLGPYSRFVFHHPGPMLFYCLAPFYVALGKSHAAQCTGALVLNLGSLVGIALALRRLGGADRWPWSLAALGLYVLWLQPALLVSVWNPDITILPLGLALVAFAAVAAGRTAWLAAAVLSASFAMQSHVPCVGPVVCAAVLAVIAWAIRRRWHTEFLAPDLSHVGRHVATAAFLGTLVWLPTFIEQVRGQPGNMTLILRYLAEGHAWRPAGPTLLALATQACGFLAAPFGVGSRVDPSPRLAQVFGAAAIGLLGLLVLLAVRGWKRRDSFALASCVGCICLLLVGLAEALAIPGTLHAYLVRWVSIVGLFSVIAVAAAMPRPGAAAPWVVTWQFWVCSLLIAVATVSGLRSVIRFPVAGEPAWTARLDRLSDATVSALAVRGVRHPHVKIFGNHAWEPAAGVVLQCTKAGRPPTVDDWWLFMFGELCRFREADDGTVLIADRTAAARLVALRGVEPIVTAGDYTVLLSSVDRPLAGELSLGDLESDLYVRTGFSGAESEPGGGFRWSRGPESWIVLPATPGLPYRLQVSACPIVVPGKQQELTVEVNGQRIATVNMAPSWAPYAFAVPAGLVRARNLVIFRYTLVRSPYELTGADDKRPLAVRFRTVSFSQAALP
jgi:hypothetical protein